MAPYYDYECVACGKHVEAFQRIDDQPLTTCPECGGELKKLIQPPEVREAGDGAEGPTVVEVPWNPTETEIHRDWKKRRKWKRDLMAAAKRRERADKRRKH